VAAVIASLPARITIQRLSARLAVDHPLGVSGVGRRFGLDEHMLARLLIRLVVLAVVIGVVAAIVPGIHVNGGFLWLLWIAVIFSVVNVILGPIFHLISLPLIVLTLGLFLLVVNAGLLAITAGLSSHLDVDNFGSAVLGGLLIAVFSALVELARAHIGARAKRSEVPS
jgi:putative membrane protein